MGWSGKLSTYSLPRIGSLPALHQTRVQIEQIKDATYMVVNQIVN
jgi:hypothetical protein